MKPDYIPVILSYGDGVNPEEIDDFIKAIRAFHENAKEQYKNEKIRYFFLPEDLVDMLNQNLKEEN